MQADPNGTGLPVAAWDAVHGTVALTQHRSIELAAVYQDGASRFAAMQNSPAVTTDPSGMFGFVGGMMTGVDMADSTMDALDQGLQGVSMAYGLYEFLVGYAIDQQFDLFWAEDWDAPDNAYSQSGIGDDAMYSVVYETYDDGFTYTVAGSKIKKPAKMRAWKGRKQHGGDEHWRKMRKEYKKYVLDDENGVIDAKINVQSVRTNQALVDKNGNKLSSMRPDVQVVDKAGNIHIVESRVSQTQASIDAKKFKYAEIFQANGLTGTYNGQKIP